MKTTSYNVKLLIWENKIDMTTIGTSVLFYKIRKNYVITFKKLF